MLAHRNPMGNLRFCKLLLYGKVCFGVFQATKTTYEPVCFLICLLYLSKKNWCLSVECRFNHWNARVKRFMKKLGSLPSRTDEISALQVSPKSNCLTKIWHKIPVFGANTSFELKHFRGFFVAQEFNTTLPHRPASMSKMARFSG